MAISGAVFQHEIIQNIYSSFEPFPKQALVLTCLQYQSFKNTVEKGEIARNEQFLLFPVFSTLLDTFLPFFIKF